MSMQEIEAREREHRAKGIVLNKQVEIAKRDGTLKSVGAEIKQWLAESDRIKADKDKAVMAAMKGYGSDSFAENKAVGRQPSVLDIPEPAYRGLWDAVQRRQPSHRIDTKSPFGEGSFTSGGLPPVLMPQLTQQLPYEPDDIFDSLIQTAAPQASSVEWLSHTGNQNPAAATSELSQKPDLSMQLTTHSQAFTKIAALASFSTESIQDFSYFMQFVPAEMFRAARDARTNEVLNGSGSSPHMLGLLNTSGTLTRSLGSDTPIDRLRKSFNDLRVGSAFANANLVV